MPNAPSPDLADFFAGTPYANAPAVVQGSTLRRAQSFLASRGIYRDPIDGAPGPATEESILNYQRSVRLPLTGRLDLETLSAMRLLPGRPSAPLRGFVPDDRQLSGQRVYRGIWVH
jgi:peptidoglycan hydrolase-like protein with peptidoglycan-binding domain